MIDPYEHNRSAWNREVERGNPWTVASNAETISAAREGRWEIVLTEQKPVPRGWLGDVTGRDILCLASGGGQQGPILAAAGARVTVFDASEAQLERDRYVAEREALALRTVRGDARDLSAFADESFDLIVHPVSNVFMAEVRPVWSEAFRVLRPGGWLLAGFMNPAVYLFDPKAEEAGVLEVRFRLPYSDLEDLTETERREYFGEGAPLEWSHTLTDQIGGQTDAGFLIAGFYEDRRRGGTLSDHMPPYIATRALRPARLR